MDEQWKPIPGYEGKYEVSDLGRVRSLDRMIYRPGPGFPRSLKGRVMKGQPVGPYLLLSLSGRTKTIHSLVLMTFVGPRPEGAVTRHLNGNPHDNRLTNLAWGTISENIRDQIAHGTHRNTSKTHCAHGHPFDKENTIWSHNNRRRECRACRRLRRLRRKERKAAA